MQASTLKNKKFTFYFKRIIGLILLLSTAAVFLFSGISKLYAFEQFTWNIMDAGVSSMTFASILGRLFISFEILLGVFLAALLYLRSFTYPAALGLLVLFTFYLIVLISRQGDSGNCGCFGEAYKMNPSAAIIKNLVMIAAIVVLNYFYRIKPYSNAIWIALITSFITLAIPFIALPIGERARPEITHEPINLNYLYHSSNPENKPPIIDLREGKHIVAFMSLTCPHCKKAAFLLQVIHRQHQGIPIFMVINGHPDNETEFFKESHAQSVPHMIFRGADEFVTMAGESVPAIYWINNGIIERKSNYFQLNPEYMKQWLEAK